MLPDSSEIPMLIDVAKLLKGRSKRLFMARTVKAMGRGGQSWAARNLGWCQDTIRRGISELEQKPSGPSFSEINRCRAAEKILPRLLDDIRDVMGGERAETCSGGRSRHGRPSAAEVRRRLIGEKGYSDSELPTRQTINKKLKMLGYHLEEKAFAG